jgi:pyruvate dehydrogenase E2 component (dihydrolipoamide acetyltransferase)
VQGQIVETTPMRAAIARRMSESKREAPHFYVSTEIWMDEILSLVEEESETNGGVRITETAALVRACVEGLREHPRLNAVWTPGGLFQADEVNIGVAVALDGGLIAPALLGADRLGLRETAQALADLVERARSSRLRPAEVGEATFTLSNLGMFQVTSFTAIVTPPQVAILAAGRSVERVRVVDGEIAQRSVMTATLSADHRAVDGVDAARFLQTLKKTLEAPVELRRPYAKEAAS